MQPSIKTWSRALNRDERGLTTVEYVIVLCLIAAAAVGSWNTFGGKVVGWLEGAEESMETEMGAGTAQGGESSAPGAQGSW